MNDEQPADGRPRDDQGRVVFTIPGRAWVRPAPGHPWLWHESNEAGQFAMHDDGTGLETIGPDWLECNDERPEVGQATPRHG